MSDSTHPLCATWQVPPGLDVDTALLAVAGSFDASILIVSNDNFEDHRDFLRHFAPRPLRRGLSVFSDQFRLYDLYQSSFVPP